MSLNIKRVSLISLVVAATAQAATPSTTGFLNPITYDSQGGHATCVSGDIPIQVTSPSNVKLNFPSPLDQYEITQFFITSFTPVLGMQAAAKLVTGPQPVTANYSIYGTLCTPKANPNDKKALQFLTHGIGFDQFYWDFLPGYSYVDVAAQSGVTTFLYDRLGIGNSSKPDGINDVQAPMELEIAHVLIEKLKQGQLGCESYPQVVGVGHSFGSLISQGVTAKYPDDFAGVVLTGVSTNFTGMPIFTGSFNLQIAADNNPTRFAGLGPAYIVTQNIIGQQQSFFHYNGFERKVLNKVEKVKQTVTLGELTTQPIIRRPATKYTKPVYVVNGAFDLAFCFGNCRVGGDIGRTVLTNLYPAVGANGQTAIINNTGHGLNLHTSAPQAFAQIQQFLAGKNL